MFSALADCTPFVVHLCLTRAQLPSYLAELLSDVLSADSATAQGLGVRCACTPNNNGVNLNSVQLTFLINNKPTKLVGLPGSWTGKRE